MPYVLFVSYFPHLIAGPGLHHKEMMPQFDDDRSHRPSASNFAVGLTILAIGLAQKVLIADNLAGYAETIFAPQGGPPSLFVAWGGALAYTFQLYFDFSGYSDMAIGLSRLFGVKLPLNFDSPDKSRHIADFWRRRHMTRSRFLRDYLYVPLVGNRRGPLWQRFNLMTTTVLGGMWHGAGSQAWLHRLGIGAFLGGGAFIETWCWVTAAALLAFAAPNTQEIMCRFEPALIDARRGLRCVASRLTWQPTRRSAVLLGLLFGFGILALSRPTQFLYFQF